MSDESPLVLELWRWIVSLLGILIAALMAAVKRQFGSQFDGLESRVRDLEDHQPVSAEEIEARVMKSTTSLIERERELLLGRLDQWRREFVTDVTRIETKIDRMQESIMDRLMNGNHNASRR